MGSKLLACSAWASFLVVLLVNARLLADPSFRLDLRGVGYVEAGPEEIVHPVLSVFIESSGLAADRVGPEAWSLALRAEACRFEDVSPGRDVLEAIVGRPESDSFAWYGIVEEGQGAVSAVILGFAEPVSLDAETSPHHALTLTMNGRIPAEGCESCVVRLENGVEGDGRPVQNLVTYKARSFRLDGEALDEATVLLCDDLCNRDPPLQVTRGGTRASVRFDESLRTACFRLEATPGTSMILEVADTAGESSGTALALYASCGPEIDPATAEFVADERSRPLQRIVIPAVCPDGYRLLAIATTIPEGETNVVLTAQEANFAVESVTPRRGARGCRISLAIRGAGFDENSSFSLVHPAGGVAYTSIEEDVTVVSSRLAEVELDLPGDADTVEYDLVLTDQGDANAAPLATLSRAFHVLPDKRVSFVVELAGNDRIRVRRLSRQTFRYENTGTVELPAPLFRIRGPETARLRLGGEDATPGDDQDRTPNELWVLGVNETGVPGKLSPGAVGEIPVEVLLESEDAAEETFTIEHLTPNPGDEIDWPAAKPHDVAMDVWMECWPKLQDQLGDTWGEYVERLAEIATTLGHRGKNPASALDAFRLAFRRAHDLPVAGLRGRISRDDDLSALADVLLFAVQMQDGEVVACAQSNSDGDFAFDGLSAGDYGIEARGYRLTQAERRFNVGEGEEVLRVELRAVADETAARELEECQMNDNGDQVFPLPRSLPVPPPASVFTPKTPRDVVFIGSWDPNEKRGSRNRGGRRRRRRPPLVDPDTDVLEYKIFFENEKPKPGQENLRTAAQRVEIIDELDDSNLDVTTVCFREFRFADCIVHLDKPGLLPLERLPQNPSDVYPFTSRCDGLVLGGGAEGLLSEVQSFRTNQTDAGFTTETTIRINHLYLGREWPLLLSITADADFTSDTLKWTLQTLEPLPSTARENGETLIARIPEDPDAGFLLPNEDCAVDIDGVRTPVSGRGEGYVSFSIRPKRTLPDRRRIRNRRVKIRFDKNPPITPDTPPINDETGVSSFEVCRDHAPLPVTSPTPPDGAEGVSRAGTLRWEPDCRAESFEVFLWPSGQPPPASGVMTPETRHRLPPALAPETSYSWRVVPRNEFGELPADLGEIRTWRFTTGISPPPETPQIVSPDGAACVYGGPIRLTWRSGTRATEYVVFVSPGPGEPPTLQIAPPAPEISLDVSPNLLQFGGDEPYRWFVVALSEDYPTTDVGTPSGEGSFRLCLPEPPSRLTPDAAGCSSALEFSWGEARGAQVYDVFMSIPFAPGEPSGPLDREIASGISETRAAIPADLEPGVYRWVVYSRSPFSEREGVRVPSLLATFEICDGIRLVRGDVNGDSEVNITDAVAILNRLFAGGDPLACRAAADVNLEGQINIVDPSFLLNHLFGGGPSPQPPFPECGGSTEESDLGLGCEEQCE